MAAGYSNLNPDYYVDMGLARSYKSRNFSTLDEVIAAKDTVDAYISRLKSLASTEGMIYRSYNEKKERIRENIVQSSLKNAKNFAESAKNGLNRNDRYGDKPYNGKDFNTRNNMLKRIYDDIIDVMNEFVKMINEITERQNGVKKLEDMTKEYLEELKNIKAILQSIIANWWYEHEK